MDKNICKDCDGTGEFNEYLGLRPKKGNLCFSCDGTGINHVGNDNLVCPFCGEDQSDSWELPDEDNKHQCDSCKKYFKYDSETVRTFTSYKIECLNDEKLHKWEEQNENN